MMVIRVPLLHSLIDVFRLAFRVQVVQHLLVTIRPRRRALGSAVGFSAPLSRVCALVAVIATVLVCFGFTVSVALADTYGVKHFTTPSGNVFCIVDNEWPKPYVRCDLNDASFSPPPRPAKDCYGRWGRSVTMTIGESPAFHCISDWAGGENLFVLKYGDDTKVGPFQCSSRESGLTCIDATTGRGFRLARQYYEFLP